MTYFIVPRHRCIAEPQAKLQAAPPTHDAPTPGGALGWVLRGLFGARASRTHVFTSLHSVSDANGAHSVWTHHVPRLTALVGCETATTADTQHHCAAPNAARRAKVRPPRPCMPRREEETNVGHN